jgi:hypothetical protein
VQRRVRRGVRVRDRRAPPQHSSVAGVARRAS